MYKLTNQQDMRYKLLITIATQNNGLKLYAEYDNFKVNSERESYKLEYRSFSVGGKMRPHFLSRNDEFQTWDMDITQETEEGGIVLTTLLP